MSKLVTPAMRQHVAGRTYDHHGFSGYRAAIACLYARPEGASQDEVNEAAAELGSTQKGYYNMLHQAVAWGHTVTVKEHATRGTVFKLYYEPSHAGPRKVAPPSNWAQMNQAPGETPLPPRSRRGKKQLVTYGAVFTSRSRGGNGRACRSQFGHCIQLTA